ncbi:DUF5000 domain-containing lipoprotein [Mucilaginibacter celer]|uniref:RagB/SusD family nutrient uptake outer membrane protein n=1 Tax=Mucilaginibacter celer TaxID=2305508 RepID=A0A494VSD0_9SPHI|nr:DUF5000 domain-containing lipoprotein [Mucilaginibacter celer]AYL98516.1 hypothetical protein HYN43_025975 [Mucilaginibacter celer]
MKIHFKYILVALLATGFLGCKKYLDVTPDNVGTIDYAFLNRNEAENYLFTCYATLQQLRYPQNDGGFTNSGEVIFPNNLSDNQGIDPTGFNLIRGTQNTQNPGLNYWNGENGGQSTFKALRRCNTMLENIDKPTDLTAGEKKRWIAEVKFLKAYYHFYLFRMYGAIPIIDKNLPITSSQEDVDIKRAPVDSVVNYMVRLLEQAAPDLPEVISNQATELGRITKPIALSVKAQILATAASPLYNGNPDYASVKNKDGQALFSSAYDGTKWDKAAAACLEAITDCEANSIRLSRFTAPANIPGNLTDSLKQVLTLQTAITAEWQLNPELIWALSPTFPVQSFCMPRLTAASAATAIFQGTFAPPISEQELFYTNKGLPIDQDASYKLSRFVMWERQNEFAYGFSNPKTFTIWGSNKAQPQDVQLPLSSPVGTVVGDWINLGNYRYPDPPSGASPTTITAADRAFVAAGVEFKVAIAAPAIHFIRVAVANVWSGGDSAHIMELSFYGKPE